MKKATSSEFGPSKASVVGLMSEWMKDGKIIKGTKENFRKIIDHKKNSGWIHISQLKKSKSLIATSNKILFRKPTKYSKPLARIEKGRLLIVKKCERNWCNIQTDKFSGWIDKTNIWGEIN